MQIEIDEDVFEYLQRQAVPLVDTPNDVLRRLLLKDEARAIEPRKAIAMRPRPLKRPPEGLSRLIAHGLVQGGDQLTHQRKRTGQTFHATVTSEGRVKLPDGSTFSAPSPALKACVGTEIDGWANWRHDRTGKTLRELRDELSG